MNQYFIVQLSGVISNDLSYIQEEYPVFLAIFIDSKINYITSIFSSLSEIQRFYVGTGLQNIVLQTNVISFDEFSEMIVVDQTLLNVNLKDGKVL